MIITASMRTDIPAFYSDWLYNRLSAGYVDVKNPYAGNNQNAYWRYRLDREVVDAFSFCTKNPLPFIGDTRFKKFYEQMPYQIWSMTITGYDGGAEWNTLKSRDAIGAFKVLSTTVGKEKVNWRFDPIIYFNDKEDQMNTVARFAGIAKNLAGYTDKVVISFLDHYDKVRRNLPEGFRPTPEQQLELVTILVRVATQAGMKLFACHDKDADFASVGANVSGCLTIAEINRITGLNLVRPSSSHNTRDNCDCVLNADIGEYCTCPNGCRYCYATYDYQRSIRQHDKHKPESSCLIGELPVNATIQPVKQFSWKQ